jgi:hypothetical protein
MEAVQEKKKELDEREGGICFWNPVEGRTYHLHHADGLFSSDEVDAVYIGTFKERYIFVRKEGDRLYHYSSNPKLPAVFVGDVGDDEPCFPYVDAVDHGEMFNKEGKAFALKRLEELVKNN